MNLRDIFQPRNQNVTQPDTVRQTAAVTAGEKNYQAVNELRHVAPGQTIQGEVIGKEGNTVQIALDSDNVLTARLEKDLNILLGQSMSFEVKSNNGSLLSLTPLYANMANEATIMKSLSAAGMSASPFNMKMISDMMQEGMSIDRDTIAYVNRQLADFPNANPSSIIQMIRLGLPITELNLEQFELYKNNEHQILQSMEQLTEELPKIYTELLSEGKTAEALSFYEQILETFAGEGSLADAEGVVSLIQEAETEGNTAKTLQPNLMEEMPKDTQEGIQGAENPGMPKADTVNAGTLDNGIVQEEAGALKNPEGAANQANQTGSLAESWQELGDMLRKLGMDSSLAKQVETGTLSPKEALTQIHTFISEHSPQLLKEGLQESVRDLFGSRGFQNLLRTEIENQWLLKPEDVAQKEKVEQLYERIREQTAKINEAFQMIDKADTAGAKSVQNLQGNLDFMHQMNQMFTYVQLPLMMAGNQAHGDLYVYTNKKSLAKNDGNVSALLHLDMEHLGPLDVYVTMQQNQKINTNFTLKDEAALDLIAEHIHILDERLTKRGYSMNANFQLKEDAEAEETNIMQEILEQNKNISVLSRTSFDMRA
ncbi:MAG: flagellar hook-length control protein FliK [Muribaculaceae bacterium]|nr:flagellar hook-length control protein FliK [Muribaculaceae bacterium]